MILPEVRVYLERAETARAVLESLLDIMPAEYFELRPAPAEWDIATHVAHIATADAPLGRLARAAADGKTAVALAPDGAAAFFAEREATIAIAAAHSLAELRPAMREARSDVAAAVARLDLRALECQVLLPAADAWGQPLAISLRQYLATWAVHDRGHEGAIRHAASTPPSPAMLAAAARIRRPRQV